MKKLFILVIVVLGLFTYTGKAQSFIITDVIAYGDKFSSSDLQEYKKKWLGGRIIIKIFDSSVKLEKWFDGNGVELAGIQVQILDKIFNNTYNSQLQNVSTTLKFETVFGYITSAKLSTLSSNKKHYGARREFKLKRE